MRTNFESGKIGLSHIEAEILRLLMDSTDELHGLEIIERSGLYAKIKLGTVYVTLNNMEQKGYVTSRQQVRGAGVGGFLKHLYRPTACGLGMLNAYLLAKAALQMRDLG